MKRDDIRTVEWDYDRNEIRLIDQRLLPGELRIAACKHEAEAAEAIRGMVVRGAPAIGVTAAFGLALAAQRSQASRPDQLMDEIDAAGEMLRAARPTAVNLSWAIERIKGVVAGWEGSTNGLRIAILEAAQKLADEDVSINRQMALNGANLISDGDTLIHHCNTGALAAVDWGTALGAIRMAHEQGKRIHVLVDETRPRLQGARLTAWELKRYGIPYEIIVDGAAGFFLRTGRVNKVLFGADRVAANGDVANKIGTYPLALAAHANHVPVYPVVPVSTFDLDTQNGDLIPIEERDEWEVLGIQMGGERVVPEGAQARNPAFDITPHHLLTAFITEMGLITPPFKAKIRRLVKSSLGQNTGRYRFTRQRRS